MDFIEISAKNVNDAITEACKRFTITSEKLEYEVIEEGSVGFLGFNSKPAVIKARIKEEKLSVCDVAKKFLSDIFKAMNIAKIHVWKVPVLLYGTQDEMIPYKIVKKFSEENNCRLNFVENGQHWLHKDREVAAMRKWEQTVLEESRSIIPNK